MSIIEKLRLGAEIDRENRRACENLGRQANRFDLILTDWRGESLVLDTFSTAEEAGRAMDCFADRFTAYDLCVAEH